MLNRHINSPYKSIAELDRPFPNSYTWKIPTSFKADRYFLVSKISHRLWMCTANYRMQMVANCAFILPQVITDDTPSQPFSNYFYIKE